MAPPARMFLANMRAIPNKKHTTNVLGSGAVESGPVPGLVSVNEKLVNVRTPGSPWLSADAAKKPKFLPWEKSTVLLPCWPSVFASSVSTLFTIKPALSRVGSSRDEYDQSKVAVPLKVGTIVQVISVGLPLPSFGPVMITVIPPSGDVTEATLSDGFVLVVWKLDTSKTPVKDALPVPAVINISKQDAPQVIEV